MGLPVAAPVAALGRRSVAYIVDSLIIGLAYVVIGVLFDALFGPLVEATPDGLALVVVAVNPLRVALELTATLVVDALYFAGWAPCASGRGCRASLGGAGDPPDRDGLPVGEWCRRRQCPGRRERRVVPGPARLRGRGPAPARPPRSCRGHDRGPGRPPSRLTVCGRPSVVAAGGRRWWPSGAFGSRGRMRPIGLRWSRAFIHTASTPRRSWWTGGAGRSASSWITGLPEGCRGAMISLPGGATKADDPAITSTGHGEVIGSNPGCSPSEVAPRLHQGCFLGRGSSGHFCVPRSRDRTAVCPRRADASGNRGSRAARPRPRIRQRETAGRRQVGGTRFSRSVSGSAAGVAHRK